MSIAIKVSNKGINTTKQDIDKLTDEIYNELDKNYTTGFDTATESILNMIKVNYIDNE